MPRFTCGIHEPVAKKITEWCVIVSGVEIAHKNVSSIRMPAHQPQLIQRAFPLPPIARHRCSGVHGYESNLLATHIHRAAGHE